MPLGKTISINDILTSFYKTSPSEKANLVANHSVKAYRYTLHILDQEVELNATIKFLRSSLFYSQIASQSAVLR